MMRQRGLAQSFKSALAGFFYCFRTQKNFRIHLLVTVIVLGLACFLKIEKIEISILLFTVLLVLTFEMINTAVEALIDLVAPDWKEKARIVKDVFAAAVLVATIGVVIIGIIIFSPYFTESLTSSR